MSRNPRRMADRVADMLEAIQNIKSDLGDASRKQFLQDGKTQRAVIESIIVLGEAGNSVMRMDPDIEQSKPELWQYCRDAYDMRIVLTHEYFRVDPAIVWATVKTDLPRLEDLLVSVLHGQDAV